MARKTPHFLAVDMKSHPAARKQALFLAGHQARPTNPSVATLIRTSEAGNTSLRAVKQASKVEPVVKTSSISRMWRHWTPSGSTGMSPRPLGVPFESEGVFSGGVGISLGRDTVNARLTFVDFSSMVS